MSISPGDEANSDGHAGNTHGRCRDIIQPPCPRNAPGPCDQEEGGGHTGKHRVCNWEGDTPNCGIAHHVLEVLRVDRRQNNSCAQSNSNAHYAIDILFALACWRTVRVPKRTEQIPPTHVQALRVAPAFARVYPTAFSTLRTNQWLRAPPPSL